MSSDFRLDYMIMRSIGNLDKGKFLDVGCGLGKWGYNIKLGWSGELEYSVGLDVWRSNLGYAKDHKAYDDTILADARFLPFTKKSFNVVCATEFIHNLKKDEGNVVLDELERVANQKVVVSLPNKGFTFGVDSRNPFEKNVSEWSTGELKKRGYSVKGIGFQVMGHRLSSIVLSGLSSISLLNKFAELIVGKKEISEKKTSS
jgi:ubiquinone/menaquinone biosynthesis C-methylase UbiE